MHTYDRTASTKEDDLASALNRALEVYQKLRTWIGEFPVILRKSKQEATDLPDDLVWQDNFVPYWHELDAWSRALLDIDDQIEAFVYEPAKPISGKVRELYYSVSKAIKFVPNKARIEFAFDEPKFEFSEKLQRKHIAYEISRLSTWADAFESWVAESEKTLLSAIKKVQSIGWKRKTAHSEQAERVVERFASSKIQVCKLRSSGEYEIHSPDCSAASTRGRKYSECELIPGTNAIDAAAYIYSDHIKNREGTAEEYADYFKTHNCLR